MKIDKDDLKFNLSIEQVKDYVDELGGESFLSGDGEMLVCKTICHCGDAHKLYYYENTHLFKCYTECDCTFDIFSLTQKVKSYTVKKEWSLPQTMVYVASYFGYSARDFDFGEEQEKLKDWEIFNAYNKLSSPEDNKIVELTKREAQFLENLPQPRILPWEKDGITYDIIKSRGIKYDAVNQSIIIPHYDIDGDVVGIRSRTLIKEEEIYGKYRPAQFGKTMYNHPLGLNLYNLNFSKNNIKILKKVFVGEGEKFCLQYASYFGADNDLTVAVCGSSLVSHQVELLKSLGVEEIIIAFDKQFKEKGDDEFKHWTKKLEDINKKYSSYVNISFMFDKENLLGYKESPTDRGAETFLKLFEARIVL